MSQQDPSSIEELVHKFQQGSITPDELETLLEWYNAHDDTYAEIPLRQSEHKGTVKARILDELTLRVRGDSVKRRRQSLSLRRWQVAAAVIAFVLVGSWAIWQYFGMQSGPTLPTQDFTIAPGGNRATLILPDGREIVLSTEQEGIVVGEGISYRDGTDLDDQQLIGFGSDGGPIGHLVLQTPRGGTYQVTLPDGTEVWLNAGSTLRYPSRFSQEQRQVEVIGEAYFAVVPAFRHDGTKIPFRVMSRQQEIEVLGTEFNISAYADQPYSRTTLVEGAIRLKDQDSEFILKPGDQATTRDMAQTTMRQVATGTFTAWRDGRFSFDGKPFAEIMNEIGHWYDLEIVYEGVTPDEELVGDAFRNQNLGLVLRVLDVAEIDYSIDVTNRKLIIK